ncbi:hypothetical protein J2X69_000358 [Algoriphagus sp. 4150]|nr:hypothetical protein [Algoriphagus sp. 4150]
MESDEIEHVEDDTQLVPNLLRERDDYKPSEIPSVL